MGALEKVRVKATDPAYADGDLGELTLDSSGHLRVQTGGGGGGAVSVADGADVALGTTTDVKNAATNATPATMIGLLKELSFLLQNALAVTGPLTDAQLRATAVPVSGPLTDTQLRATAVPVSGPLTDTALRASAVPVSGPLTDTQLRASAVPVSGPLTDTALRASAVPVSLAALPALVAGAAIVGKVGIDQTTPGTTNGVQVNAALPAGTNLLGKVGIDQTTPGTTNAIYDTSGKWADPALRQSWTFSAVAVAGVTTEALLSSVASTANVAAGAATSYTVPVGKTLRITSFHIDAINTSTVASRASLTVRAVPPAGTLAASSPIVHRLVAQVIGALAGNAGADDISLPEGFCLPAGSIVGVSQLCLATTCTVSFCLTGYLY